MGPNVAGRPPIDAYLARVRPDYSYGAATMPYVGAAGKLDTVSLDTPENLSIAQSSLEGLWKYYGKVRHDLGVNDDREIRGKLVKADSQYTIQEGSATKVYFANKITHQAVVFGSTPHEDIPGVWYPDGEKLLESSLPLRRIEHAVAEEARAVSSSNRSTVRAMPIEQGAEFLFGVSCGVVGMGKGFSCTQGVHWLGTRSNYHNAAGRKLHRDVRLHVSNSDFTKLFKSQLGLAGTDGANMALGLVNILTAHENIIDIIPPLHASFSPSNIICKLRKVEGRYILPETVQPFLNGIETDEYTVPAAMQVTITQESRRHLQEIITGREEEELRYRPVEMLISAGSQDFGFTLDTYPEQLAMLDRRELVPVALQGLEPQ